MKRFLFRDLTQIDCWKIFYGIFFHLGWNNDFRDIRDENEEYRDYSLKMKKYAIPETRLVPLVIVFVFCSLVHHSSKDDPSTLMILLKIFVCYTLPLKKDDSCYNELRIGLLRFAESFISNVVTFSIDHLRMPFLFSLVWFRKRLRPTSLTVIKRISPKSIYSSLYSVISVVLRTTRKIQSLHTVTFRFLSNVRRRFTRLWWRRWWTEWSSSLWRSCAW